MIMAMAVCVLRILFRTTGNGFVWLHFLMVGKLWK